ADQQRAAHTIGRWAEALAGVPANVAEVSWDAVHAVRRYYEQRGGDRSAQFRAVEPHDLLAAWTPHRAELMNRHTDPVPAADPSAARTAPPPGRPSPPADRPPLPTGRGGPRACKSASPLSPQVWATARAPRPSRRRRPSNSPATGRPAPHARPPSPPAAPTHSA